MKILPPRAALRGLAVAAAILLALLGLASVPWGGERAPAPPRVVATARGAGPLRAGVAEARFDLPRGVPIGGFPRLRYRSEEPPEPVGARALVLEEPGCRVALVSAEILLVPESLHAEVAAEVSDLGLSGLILGATHTHAGPGGYVESVLFERIATGPYDPALRAEIVRTIVRAIREAAASLAPARLAAARATADGLARSRSGGREDAPLTVVRLARPGGVPLAEVTVFAAHATILGSRSRAVSGDWPGTFLQGGAHGLRVFFQGAIGDQSTDGPSAGSLRSYAHSLAAHVNGLPFPPPDASPALAYSSVEVGLPDNDVGAAPWPFGPAARNLARRVFPATARVHALRLGPVLLLAVPAEPVSAVGATWRRTLSPDAAVLSFANGYLGYVEEPSRVKARTGETHLTYYGPTLAGVLGGALEAAAHAVERPGTAAIPAR